MDKLTPDERVAALRALLQLPTLDSALALQALSHKSYGNENPPAADNERLEFLGDAVLDLLISHELMLRSPQSSEGELSKRRALLVSAEALARIGRDQKLGSLFLLGRGEELSGGRLKSSLLADGLEAVLGAVYLSLGIDAARGVVQRWFADALTRVEAGQAGDDFKTRLQEHVQFHLKQPVRYQVVGEGGPDHEKRFEVQVSIGDVPHARGEGRSKKEAEQAAAQKTLALLAPVEQKGGAQEDS
jgi:ribonuclease-3